MEQADRNQAGTVDGAANHSQAALRQGLQDEIKRLRRFANRGLWALSLFLLVSTLAWREFWFLPPAERIVASLGPPPPPLVISMVLVLYTFSAIILSLSRLMGGVEHKSSFCHVGYVTVFYLFYYFAQSLPDNYWAVFCAGCTVLCMESYRIWTFCSLQISRREERLSVLDRTGRLPLDETQAPE